MEITISQEVQERIAAATNLDEVVQICTADGIAVTKEQLEAGLLPESEAELDEDMLNNVSGGGIFNLIRRIISYYRASKYNSGGGGFSRGGGGTGSFGGGGGGGR